MSYRADQILNSMTAFKDDMGYPPPLDAGIVVHGDLGTQIHRNNEGAIVEIHKSLAEMNTTYARVDDAFRRGSIDGFEEVKSLGAFWKFFQQDGVPAPKKLTA